jgi:hypothetical protein
MSENGPKTNLHRQLYKQIYLAIEEGFVFLLDEMWQLDNEYLSIIEAVMATAVRHQHLPVVEWLYSKGEPIFEDSIEAACHEPSIEILAFLLSKSAPIPKYAAFMVIEYNSRKTEICKIQQLKLLQKAGVNINDPEERLLEFARHERNMEVLEFLVGNGSDINVHHGRVLCHAVGECNYPQVKMLINLGADITHVFNRETNKILKIYNRITYPMCDDEMNAEMEEYLTQFYNM